MRSCLYPSPKSDGLTFNTMDLGLSLDLPPPSTPEPALSNDWESWGEESTIDLCEVQLKFDGALISMLTISLL